jgi:hypothetical protein
LGALVAFAGLQLLPSSASAAEPTEGVTPDSAPPPQRDVKGEIPILAYAYTAHGVSAGTFGAQAYGTALAGNRKPTLGGGGMIWGSPIDRLTLVGDFGRDVFGHFAPSAAAVVRLLGRANDGFSLGAIGKFKVEGFGVGPNNEVESEMETGLLLSYVRAGWHFDLNAITGFGLGDDEEIDTEGRLRLGYDLTSIVRVGVDGQARYRLHGIYRLPGNRNGDFAAGPQILVGSSRFFGAFTAGPASMGITDRDRAVGWSAMLSLGGTN